MNKYNPLCRKCLNSSGKRVNLNVLPRTGADRLYSTTVLAEILYVALDIGSHLWVWNEYAIVCIAVSEPYSASPLQRLETNRECNVSVAHSCGVSFTNPIISYNYGSNKKVHWMGAATSTSFITYSVQTMSEAKLYCCEWTFNSVII